jgi:hypothetical protein
MAGTTCENRLQQAAAMAAARQRECGGAPRPSGASGGCKALRAPLSHGLLSLKPMQFLSYESFEVVKKCRPTSRSMGERPEKVVKYTYTYNNRLTIPFYIFLPVTCDLRPKSLNAALFNIGMVLLPWLWTIYFWYTVL